MLARPTRDATPPALDESSAQLEHQLAALQARLAQTKAKERQEADERAHYEGAKVLAPASPSPREYHFSEPPPPPLGWAGSALKAGRGGAEKGGTEWLLTELRWCDLVGVGKKRGSVMLEESGLDLSRPKQPRLREAYDSTLGGPPPPIIRKYDSTESLSENSQPNRRE